MCEQLFASLKDPVNGVLLIRVQSIGFFIFRGWLALGSKLRELPKAKLPPLAEVQNVGARSLAGGVINDRKSCLNLTEAISNLQISFLDSREFRRWKRQKTKTLIPEGLR